MIDPLVSTEVAAAALALYRSHRGDRPVVAVIYTHSHVDHFGGVLGVTTQADVDAGRVAVLAPEGFLDHAVQENVYAGTAMTRRAAYMYGTVLARGAQGQVGCGLGQTRPPVRWPSSCRPSISAPLVRRTPLTAFRSNSRWRLAPRRPPRCSGEECHAVLRPPGRLEGGQPRVVRHHHHGHAPVVHGAPDRFEVRCGQRRRREERYRRRSQHTEPDLVRIRPAPRCRPVHLPRPSCSASVRWPARGSTPASRRWRRDR